MLKVPLSWNSAARRFIDCEGVDSPVTRFKPIPSHPGYFAGEDGSILGKRGKLLRQFPGTGGYLRFTTFEAGRWQQVSTHVMVCEAFFGPRPSRDHHAAHRNGICTDNRVENLRWATKVENEADKLDHGVRPMGEMHPHHKLTEDQVRSIRSRKTPLQEEAVRYGVSITTISYIRNRKTWRHI